MLFLLGLILTCFNQTLKNKDRKINVMYKTLDRKSLEVGGHWQLWRGWKTIKHLNLTQIELISLILIWIKHFSLTIGLKWTYLVVLRSCIIAFLARCDLLELLLGSWVTPTQIDDDHRDQDTRDTSTQYERDLKVLVISLTHFNLRLKKQNLLLFDSNRMRNMDYLSWDGITQPKSS